MNYDDEATKVLADQRAKEREQRRYSNPTPEDAVPEPLRLRKQLSDLRTDATQIIHLLEAILATLRERL